VVMTATRLTNDVMSFSAALRGIEIHMPPLRVRRDDIPLLTAHFVQSLSHGPSRASSRLLRLLAGADWPGNVRQLREVVATAATRATGAEINVDDLAYAHQTAVARNPLSRLEEAELHQIRDALTEANGNRVKAAAILQIGRSTLYRKIEMYQ